MPPKDTEVIDLTSIPSPISLSGDDTPNYDPNYNPKKSRRKKKKRSLLDRIRSPETINDGSAFEEREGDTRARGINRKERRKLQARRRDLEDGEIAGPFNLHDEQVTEHSDRRKQGEFQGHGRRVPSSYGGERRSRVKDQAVSHMEDDWSVAQRTGRKGGSRERDRNAHGHREGITGPESIFFVDLKPAELSDNIQSVKSHGGSRVDVEETDPEGAHNSGLTLPAHVTVGDAIVISKPVPPVCSDDEDFIHFVDYDDTQKGAKRYFDQDENGSTKASTLCKKCGAEGEHKSSACPVMICLTCGVRDEHSTRGCPISKTCFSCGMKGHINQNCPQRYTTRRAFDAQQGYDCERCGSDYHKTNECPTLWRLYEYVTDEVRRDILKKRKSKEDLPTGHGGEGFIAEDEWCYNCGGDGHLGDDCDEVTFPHDFPKEPSAFSTYNTLSGPFADPNASRPSRRKRQPREWEHDGLFTDGYGFTGPTDVGRKGRTKERDRMRQYEDEVMKSEDDDDDWFRNRNGPPRSNGFERKRKAPVFQLSIKGQSRKFEEARYTPSRQERGSSRQYYGGYR
ncbi:hypothetical protein BD410DRAFT_780129 [Rickenella mellea]|uniref:CCHC-type domain-containing protein n=1 Tax=Rickenella mellea TaxID=50990 RepID=A0A4R5XFU2_9AGAM|nr:hypothetical protein BD410DRAFT_780129 [Rickenella mellea]